MKDKLTLKNFKKLLLILLALFVVAEIILRIASAMSTSKYGSILQNMEITKEYWRIKPNLKLIQPTRHGDLRYTSNAIGFRSQMRPKGKNAPGNKYRLLTIGDSITYGIGVNDEQTYPYLLERNVNKQKLLPRGIHVNNLGMGAFSTPHQLHVLKKYGLKYKPKMVVLQLQPNDYYVRFKKGQNAPKMSLYQRLRGVTIALWRMVMHRSLAYIRLDQGVEMVGYMVFHDWRRNNPEHLNRSLLKRTAKTFKQPYSKIVGFDELLEIKALSKKHGFKLFVFYSPDEVELFDKTFDHIPKKIEAFCRKHKIDFASPVAALRKTKIKHVFLDGAHYTPYGMKELLKWLQPQILQRIKAVPTQPTTPAPTSRKVTPKK